MTTPVNFLTAKRLNEIGFDIDTDEYYVQIFQDTFKLTHHKMWEMDEESGFQNTSHYPAPTIAEVVMWIYDKYGIWIWVERFSTLFRPYAEEIGDERFSKWEGHKYNSPTEAYEAAIEYISNELI